MKSAWLVKYKELIIEIEADYSRKSRWIYVKMQSLIELVNNAFVDSDIDVVKDFNNLSNILITKYIVDNYIKSKSVYRSFYLINQFANVLKHCSEYDRLREVAFDSKIIDSFFTDLSKYWDELFIEESYIQRDLKSIQARFLQIVNRSNVSEMSKTNTMSLKQATTKHEKSKHEIPKSAANKQEKEESELKRAIVVTNGFGYGDFGFEIYGMVHAIKSIHENASLYATIYSFLKRSSRIKKPFIILEAEKKLGYDINYRNVYMYSMIILNMIRFNYVTTDLVKVYSKDDDPSALKLAVQTINFYGSIISKLRGMNYIPLTLDINKVSEEGFVSVSYSSIRGAEIYCSILAEPSPMRDYWYEKSIRYNPEKDKENIEGLHILLKDFFNYSSFKPGQLNALFSVLKSNSNSIIMLPTGGGKSLLYYFVALLQPNPTIIVSPTNILIKDQMRNLIELHNIDDCIGYFSGKTTLRYKDLNVNHFDISKKFVFITPEVFQQKKALKDLATSNLNKTISTVILDEVHYVSNWSHNFRPDYLMLSHNLTTYLSEMMYIGFTATASYRVLDDVIKQLRISKENIYVPIELKRINIDYSFRDYTIEDELVSIFKKEVEEIYNLSGENDKAIIYTSQDMVNKKLMHEIDRSQSYDIDIFNEFDPNSYEGFVSGRKSILISNGEIGIGVNIPMVKKIVHLCLPISKGQYVQELGRVERFEGKGLSCLYFKRTEALSSIERKILNYNTPTEELCTLLDELDDKMELKKIFVKILGPVRNKSQIEQMLLRIYDYIILKHRDRCSLELEFSNIDEVQIQQICIYFLTLMGVISSWSVVHFGEKIVIYEMETECKPISDYKRKIVQYIVGVDYSKEIAFEVENAVDIAGIVQSLLKWYQMKYVQYHREQFLSLLDFCSAWRINSNNSIEVSKHLSEYFSSPLIKYGEDVLQDIALLNLKGIINLVDEHVAVNNTKFVSHIEKMIENEYHVAFDFYLFIYYKTITNFTSYSRLERILNSIDKNTEIELLKVASRLYPDTSTIDEKLKIITLLNQRYSIKDLLISIFDVNQRDIIYYGYSMKIYNEKLF